MTIFYGCFNVLIRVYHQIRLLKLRLLTYLAWKELHVKGIQVGTNVRIIGMPVLRVPTNANIKIGCGSTLCSDIYSNDFGIYRPCLIRLINEQSSLEIGTDCGLSGVSIYVENSVRIGDRVRLGANTTIMDGNMHDDIMLGSKVIASTSGDGVVIGDDVFIGANSIILPGTEIGSASVVAAGSIVKGQFPPGSLIRGVLAN